MQLQKTKFISLLATITAMAGFAACIGSCLEADTIDDLSWTFETGLVLWGIFVVLEFCIVLSTVKSNPKLSRKLKVLLMIQESLKLILLSEALYVAIRVMMLPVVDNSNEMVIADNKEKLLTMAIILFIPVMLLQVLVAYLQNREKK